MPHKFSLDNYLIVHPVSNKIELDYWFEEPILNTIVVKPGCIGKLPKELYQKFYDFLIQEERYEDITQLLSVRSKVVNISLNELLTEITSNFKP
jgi:hypothetical protein